jgi:hypothetical protein
LAVTIQDCLERRASEKVSRARAKKPLTRKREVSGLFGSNCARGPGDPASYNGIARLDFIDNATTTTAIQSENAPKASDAATASINRGEATLALWP